jgi:hypothetical protein
VTILDDQRAVIELACLTEHRSNAEQDALLRVAAKAEAAANALVVTNKRSGPAWRLYDFVEETRCLEDGDRPRAVAKLAAKLREKADRWDEARRP